MIQTNAAHFRDEHGRTLILRGINLSGSSKLPAGPDGATHRRAHFYDHRTVSFVGRPFPLAEAGEHFERLRRWGFMFLRLVVTWEAIEHAGPGQYDEAYLDYVEALVRKAGDYGMHLVIDPHQDVWSRFTGGSGAPGWTLEAAGMELTHLHATGASFLHQEHGDPFPRMIWPTNATRLAAATMFTLFFGGSDFAPAITVDGEPIQEYLQRHYIGALRRLAQRLQGLSHVVGYEAMNEPWAGYIGWRDLTATGGVLRMGPTPTPYQSMLLAAGFPQSVEVYSGAPFEFGLRRRQRVNPQGVRLWREGFDCIWRRHGVWDVDAGGAPRLNRPDYFQTVHGRRVDFVQDYLLPFTQRFAAAIHQIDPGAAIFVQTEVMQPPPRWDTAAEDHAVFAPHWYDVLTLFSKRYQPLIGVDNHSSRPVFGAGRIRQSFASQLRAFRHQAAERMPGAPVIVGEYGIPYDLDNRRAFTSGSFAAQTKAMDRSMQAVEDALVSAALWHYAADNTHAHGDGWNGEDLSIFSRDQQQDPADPDSGGRALAAVVRPHARAVAGEPLHQSFNLKARHFAFEFRHDPAVAAPTEIFVPAIHYAHGCAVTVSDGEFSLDRDRQLLLYRHSQERLVHVIHIMPD